MKDVENLSHLLSKRIDLDEIQNLQSLLKNNPVKTQELLDCIIKDDKRIGSNAAWVMTHLYSEPNNWLYNIQDILKEVVLSSKNNTKKRLALVLISRQSVTMHIPFLDYCLSCIINKEVPVGIRCLCIKIAYHICTPIPEMLHEFYTILELIEPNPQPALCATFRHILKAKNKQIKK